MLRSIYHARWKQRWTAIKCLQRKMREHWCAEFFGWCWEGTKVPDVWPVGDRSTRGHDDESAERVSLSMITSIKVIMDTHVSLLGPREPEEVQLSGRPSKLRIKTEYRSEVKLLTFDASSLLVRTEAKNARPRDNRVVSHQTEGWTISRKGWEKPTQLAGPNKFGGQSLARSMRIDTQAFSSKTKRWWH